MACQLSGCAYGSLPLTAERACDSFDLAPGHRARPEKNGLSFHESHHRRLQTERGVTAVEDKVDTIAKFGGYVRRRCRTDVSRDICAWRGDWDVRLREQLRRDGMRWDTQRNRLKTGADQKRNAGGCLPSQHQSEWSRPELFRQLACKRGELRQRFRGRLIAHMHDQRVDPGPALNLEQPGHGFSVARV